MINFEVGPPLLTGSLGQEAQAQSVSQNGGNGGGPGFFGALLLAGFVGVTGFILGVERGLRLKR